MTGQRDESTLAVDGVLFGIAVRERYILHIVLHDAARYGHRLHRRIGGKGQIPV